VRIALVVCLAIAAAPGTVCSQQKKASVAATLERLEREYINVQTITDTARGRRLVEPGALVINPDGSTLNGEQMLQAGWSGEAVLDSLTVDSVMVRQLAPTEALAYARGYQRGHFKQASGVIDVTGEYVILDVWRRRDGHWRVAGEQGQPIKKP